jgi:hypothetical protein
MDVHACGQDLSRADTGLTLASRNGSTMLDFPNIRDTIRRPLDTPSVRAM